MTGNDIPHHPGEDFWTLKCKVCSICGLEKLPTPVEIKCVIEHTLLDCEPDDAKAKAELVKQLREYAHKILLKAREIESTACLPRLRLRPIKK